MSGITGSRGTGDVGPPGWVPMDPNRIREGFARRFQVVPALTPYLRDQVFRLRHAVYCEDLRYEPIRPDGREKDEYDRSAVHLLLRHLPDNEFVGCARLVRPEHGNPGFLLPFERVCADTLDRTVIDPAQMPRERIAEVSRLAVIAKFRRRHGEAFAPVSLSDEDFGDSGRVRYPFILVGLYLGVVAIAALHGIDKLFLLSEPRLASHFARLGIRIVQIGPGVEHRGVRVPSVMDVASIVGNLNPHTFGLYGEIMEEVAPLFSGQSSRVVVPRQTSFGPDGRE